MNGLHAGTTCTFIVVLASYVGGRTAGGRVFSRCSTASCPEDTLPVSVRLAPGCMPVAGARGASFT